MADGVIFDGNLDLATYDSEVIVTGGLTLNGTVDIGNDSANAGTNTFGDLVFSGGGNQTLSTTSSGTIISAPTMPTAWESALPAQPWCWNRTLPCMARRRTQG